MMKKLLLTLTLIAASFSYAAAQSMISGVVTDATSEERLPGVNVVISELSIGASTDADGQYQIMNVPDGSYTLTVTYVGYKKFEEAITVSGTDLTIDIALEQDILGLEEVVLTGVGRGTQTTKLGFSVAKISEKSIEEVPPADVGNAIRAKVPGVTILQASGDPSAPATIRLRGSTSLGSDQSPLIIVDGVITDGNIRDINMLDVESIEVVKGAAAASIYGSLAGNGVIQILTKRGGDTFDKPRVTFKSENGFSQIANKYPSTDKHPWNMDGIVLSDDGRYILEWPNYEVLDTDADGNALGFVNNYPVFYDNIDNVFTGQPYSSNYVSVSSSARNYNYSGSYELYNAGGVLDPVDPFKRNTLRFNADYVPDSKLRTGISASYVTTSNPTIIEQGQGNNYFYSVLTSEPFMDLTEKNPDGTYSNKPTGYDVQGSNWSNPLYVAEQRQFESQRDRILAGVNASYDLLDNLSVNARQSLDKRYQTNSEFYPKGYQTPTPSATVNDGFYALTEITSSTAISEFWLEYAESFDKFNVSAIAKYLYENREYESVSASGYNFNAQGVVNLGAVDPSTYSIGSYQQTEKAENYFVNVDLDYDDKLIVSGMIRRDGSSSFGEEERYQTYYRGSLAYRITQDFDISNVQEWKIRASYGTSGQRPPFAAQYETFNVSASGISPNILGNNAIKPSTVAELEVGTDLSFLDRFSFVANYAVTNVENDYLLVPLPPIAGYGAQWQNVGKIENKTLEFGLNGQLVNTKDVSWSFNVSWDKTSQMITDLGGPGFTLDAGGALALFRIEEGVSYGAMYGNIIATSLDQLTTDADGFVINYGSGLTLSDFEVNPDGYVIQAGTHGTADESVVYVFDEVSGERLVGKIGDTNPDFKMGISTNYSYKGFGVYALFDWVQGGDVYNYTKQLLYFNYRHEDLETYTNEGYHFNYMQGNSLYNLSDANQHFVEDASYVKLRELAFSYTLGQDKLGALGQYVSDVKFSVIGRNLLTFTNYTGWDPEVALRSNATNFRLDEYAYPNFRTFSASVQVRF